MMTNQVAAAFEDGYKEKICRIKKGDYVFLYASGQGIVAYGQATGIVETTHHYGVDNKTFFKTRTFCRFKSKSNQSKTG